MQHRASYLRIDETTVVEPVRIAFLITELDVGGAERCLVNLATGMDRARFQPMVCSIAPRPRHTPDMLVRQLEEADVPVHFLNAHRATQFFGASARLKRWLRDQRITLLQTFLFHANVLGPLAARAAGVSSVVSGIRVADPTRWRMWLERYASRHVDQVVCVSDSVATFARQQVGLPADKLQVIRNGIDLAPFSAIQAAETTAVGIPEGRRILLVVGRLHPQKGLDWLLRLAPAILRRLPQHDLIILGEGPERHALIRQADSFELGERVHFLGWRPDVAGWLRASDILLLPSRWEGLPNVVLEAMASSLPVVATAVEGVREALGPLADEQAVPGNDDQAFVDTVVRIADDRTLAARLGQANRQRVADHFSLASMIRQYEQLYATSVGLQECGPR